MLFTIVDDAHVILRSKGVYRQAKIYERDGVLYAGWGSGFIGLRKGNSTTLPNVTAVGYSHPGFTISFTPDGRLALNP